MSYVQIIPLGGLDEIGKNLYIIQYKNEIVVIDCGLKFPDDDLPGVDRIIPDFSYLIENSHKVKGIFVTHGHEDHIGGLPYLSEKIPVPIYGSLFSVGLVKSKIEEYPHLRKTKFHVVNERAEVQFDYIKVTFFRTNHSIPDSLGIVVHTPEGLVIHTGDFKFDLSSSELIIDFFDITKTNNQHVLALLSDSTNSERAGSTPSDQMVGISIDRFIRDAKQRVFFSTFASNGYRIQQVIEAAEKYGRKIAFLGRSMERIFEVGKKTGYLKADKQTIMDADSLNRLKPHEAIILCTGSQGEPNAALARLARGVHNKVEILPGDTVIVSSSPIPGNTRRYYKLIDQLFRIGAQVIYGSALDIHASGHGSQTDLLLMLNLIKPQYFIPIHGEYRMLVAHARLAEQTGIHRKNIFILNNGDSLLLSRNQAKKGARVPSGTTLVDGSGIGDVGTIVLRDRLKLSESGIVLIVFAVDMKSRRLLSKPEIISRGFVYIKESDQLLDEARKRTVQIIHHLLATDSSSWAFWKQEISKSLSEFLLKKTGRSPMVIPIISEVEIP